MSPIISEAQAREQTVCVGCGKPKDKGLVVCWHCFKHRQDITPFKEFEGGFEAWQATLPKKP